MNRYERQIRLNVWDQRVIQKTSVLIVGVGGTGCEVSKNLALMGIGKLILVDPDVIELSNLNRQFFYHEQDVGRSKVSVAKERIQILNPEITVEIYQERIQDAPMRLFKEVDIVVGCVDNFLARQYMNSQCVLHDKVLVDSATDGYLGQVQVVIPKNTACLACHSPEPPDETRIVDEPCTFVGIPRRREHCAWKAWYQFHEMHSRDIQEENARDVDHLLEIANNIAREYGYHPFEREEILEMLLHHVPSIISVNALIAATQTQEIIKIIFLLKKKELNSKTSRVLNSLEAKQLFRVPSLTVYAGLTSTYITYDLTPDINCPVCSETVNPPRMITIQASSIEAFREALHKRYGSTNLWISRNEMMIHLSELDNQTGKKILRDGELLSILREEDGHEEKVLIVL